MARGRSLHLDPRLLIPIIRWRYGALPLGGLTRLCGLLIGPGGLWRFPRFGSRFGKWLGSPAMTSMPRSARPPNTGDGNSREFAMTEGVKFQLISSFVTDDQLIYLGAMSLYAALIEPRSEHGSKITAMQHAVDDAYLMLAVLRAHKQRGNNGDVPETVTHT